MGKRRSVPENLMGNILSENFDDAEERETFSETPDTAGPSQEKGPGRIGVTFNLPKPLAAELESLRWEMRSGEEARPSRSELAEVALRIAAEDARERGEKSELYQRLAERRADRVSDAATGTTRRSVDDSGWIFETTHDANGQIVDEVVVGTVADLPVTDEYVDGQGRLVSVSKDDLGNVFEQVMDENFNTLETKLLQTPAPR